MMKIVKEVGREDKVMHARASRVGEVLFTREVLGKCLQLMDAKDCLKA